ncbi:hypothetical protein, partial [Pseudovibrio axinellae]|uniref:hypothetical protein n=1 Tax=Pseudovibrio axinellae TaxID=989403 RepID=UPI00193E43D2
RVFQRGYVTNQPKPAAQAETSTLHALRIMSSLSTELMPHQPKSIPACPRHIPASQHAVSAPTAAH